MKYREGMIWLEVQAAQSDEPLHFLLDSGAGASVINLSTARRLGLRPGRRIEVQGVGCTTTGYFPQRLTATVAGVPLPRQYVAVDLDQLSGACHCRVDGLLGADFFRNRIVQIDFESEKIRLLSPGTPVRAEETLPLKSKGNALVAPVTVNGKERQWLRVDTGCAAGLHWVTKRAPGADSSRRVAIALKEVSVDIVPAEVVIGKTALGSVPAEIHPDRIFGGEDGLLGNGILARFRSITIDTTTGKLAFEF